MSSLRETLDIALSQLRSALPDWGADSQAWVLGGLTALTVVLMGAALMLLRRSKRESTLVRQRAAGVRGDDTFQDSSRVSESLQSVGKAVSAGSFSDSLRIKLMRAGFQNAGAPAIYLGGKVLLLFLGLSLSGLAAVVLGLPFQFALFLTVFGGVAAFVMPDLYVAYQREARQSEVRRRLPDAVDLLEICVSSGMGLDMAWQAVAEEVRRVSTVLADEMELTRLEINLGIPRTEAMRHLAERTGLAGRLLSRGPAGPSRTLRGQHRRRPAHLRFHDA